MTMAKGFLIFISFLVAVISCTKPRCSEFTLYELSKEISTYFDNYKIGDAIVFRSRTKMDTIKVVSVKFDTGRTDLKDCKLANNKDVIFHKGDPDDVIQR